MYSRMRASLMDVVVGGSVYRTRLDIRQVKSSL